MAHPGLSVFEHIGMPSWTVEQFYEDLQDFLELTHNKDVLFITVDRNAKVGSQEIPGLNGKFELGEENEAKEYLIKSVEDEVKHETAVLVKELENSAREEADKKAKEYINMI